MGNSPGSAARPAPREEPFADRALYERLAGDSIVAADRQGRVIDHVTARRLAILLAASPQQREFAQGLARFIRTGAVTQVLRTQLRVRARSATSPDQAQAARLMAYCTARSGDLGPVGEDFGRACDQIDRSDVMLAGPARAGHARHRRTRPSRARRPDHGAGRPGPREPECEPGPG